APLMIPVRCKGLAAAGNLFAETAAIAVAPALRRRRERAECQFRVCDDTEFSRIVPADLRLVGVNVNPARWRHRKGGARIPPACARWNARSMMRGRSSTRSTRYTRLQNGR